VILPALVCAYAFILTISSVQTGACRTCSPSNAESHTRNFFLFSWLIVLPKLSNPRMFCKPPYDIWDSHRLPLPRPPRRVHCEALLLSHLKDLIARSDAVRYCALQTDTNRSTKRCWTGTCSVTDNKQHSYYSTPTTPPTGPSLANGKQTHPVLPSGQTPHSDQRKKTSQRPVVGPLIRHVVARHGRRSQTSASTGDSSPSFHIRPYLPSPARCSAAAK
jgi:hypothetical protein